MYIREITYCENKKKKKKGKHLVAGEEEQRTNAG
jgi:hypothetical protein